MPWEDVPDHNWEEIENDRRLWDLPEPEWDDLDFDGEADEGI